MNTAKPSQKGVQGSPRSAKLKVAILGFGTVGSSVARILCDRKIKGIELAYIFNRGVERKRVSWVPKTVQWTENFKEVLTSDVDVVLELAGGLEPAGDWVRKSLQAGKSVVTANKKLISYEGIALEKLAKKRGVHLLYGAAVAGGIPVIPAIQQGLSGDKVERIEGILNGTCNFILSKMECGESYEAVLAEAQSLGYAEANPTEDVDSFDARAKLVILMRLALGVDVHPESVSCRSIRSISALDFSYAKDLNCTIRQISRAELVDGVLSATAGPMLVPSNSPLAWSRGTENMVVSTGHYGAKVVFSGHGAGGNPTAVAVVSDLLAVLHNSHPVQISSKALEISGEPPVPHYIRFVVKDRPGIVAHIAGALAEHHINIDAILQRPGHSLQELPFVVTVEPCKSSVLKRALNKIAKFDFLIEKPLDMQILR